MHLVEDTIGQHTQGMTTRGKRFPRRHILRVPERRTPKAASFLKAEHA
jgi:hypothetical protein